MWFPRPPSKTATLFRSCWEKWGWGGERERKRERKSEREGGERRDRERGREREREKAAEADVVYVVPKTPIENHNFFQVFYRGISLTRNSPPH